MVLFHGSLSEVSPVLVPLVPPRRVKSEPQQQNPEYGSWKETRTKVTILRAKGLRYPWDSPGQALCGWSLLLQKYRPTGHGPQADSPAANESWEAGRKGLRGQLPSCVCYRNITLAVFYWELNAWEPLCSHSTSLYPCDEKNIIPTLHMGKLRLKGS